MPSTTPDFLAQVRSAEDVRRQAHEAEVRRQAFSGYGMDLPAFVAKTDAQLRAEADQAKASREVYLTSNLGKARMKIAEGSRLSERLHARLQDVGSALSRGDGSAIRKAEDVAEVLRDLRIAVADMEVFVRLSEAGAQTIAAE